MFKTFTLFLSLFYLLNSNAQFAIAINLLNNDYLSIQNINSPSFILDIPEPAMGSIEITISDSKGLPILKGEQKNKFFTVGSNHLDWALIQIWMPIGKEGLLLKNGGKIYTGDFLISTSISFDKEPSKKMTSNFSISLPKIEPMVITEMQEVGSIDNKLTLSWTMPQLNAENKQYKLRILEATGQKLTAPNLQDNHYVFETVVPNNMFSIDRKGMLNPEKNYYAYVVLEADDIIYSTSQVLYLNSIKINIPNPIEKTPVKEIKSK